MVSSKVMRALLKVAMRVLQGVISEITSQMKIVEGISNSIKGSYLPLLSSWQGDSADAFRQEIQSKILPQVVSLGTSILGMNTGIEKAVTTIQETDNKTVAQVEDLASKFRAIYKY